jgi:DNA-binding transcriptional ArsR family regulator
MTPASRKNPYRPGVGTRPLYLAGRDAPIRRFRAMLRAAPEQPANMRLTGLRGVGKTVLLGEFESVAEDDGWAAATLEFQPGHNAVDSMVDAITSIARAARDRISRAERLKSAVGNAARKAGALSLSWGDFALTYTPAVGEEREELTRALFDAVETAVSKGYQGFTLLLDEAQVIRDETKRSGEHPLSLLISSVVALQRREIPLGFVLCGLPTLTGNLLRARSYTERMFRGEEIGSLGSGDAREAFLKPLAETEATADAGLVEKVIDEVEGYPYFIQLWGAELWDATQLVETDRLTERLLEATRGDIYRRLDFDFYEPRVSTLTPAEQDVLLGSAYADYPPLVVSKLNDAINKTPANVNVLLGRLVDAGVLYRIRKGEYDYTAPRFRDYLLRRTGQTDRAESLF